MTGRRSNPTKVIIDVGSTVIKHFRIDNEVIIESGFFPRDLNRLAGDQVTDILDRELCALPGHDVISICSSANGGIRVGIIGYTRRFSGSWAAKAAFNAGANVCWVTDLANVIEYQGVAIDVLIVAGGMDNSPISRQVEWIAELKELNLQSDRIIFCGNSDLREIVSGAWPGSVHAGNVLGEDLRWSGESLGQLIREAYLSDLVNRKEIEMLSRYTETPIFPTPAVVQESYKVILRGEAGINLPQPLLLLDIGGATTDVFYGGELIVSECNSFPGSSLNRYVFPYLGISASRQSLLEHLSTSDRLGDFLRVVDADKAEHRYLSFLEGETSWATPVFLAEACCFLALSYISEGRSDCHKLDLARVQAIILTGGASQICELRRLELIFKLCGASHASAYLDNEYRIWTEGMTEQALRKDDIIDADR
jgi:hypothetical protein